MAHARRFANQSPANKRASAISETAHFCQVGIPFLAYGSFSLSLGNLAVSVKVSPKGMLILEAALIAQPLALSKGAMLRRRSFSHAITIDGPEITSIMPTKAAISCHKSRSRIPLNREVRAVPIMPTAIPMAAAIPANLAMSKGGAALASAASASATGAALIFAVMSFIMFASLSAALLLMKSSMATAIRR